MGVGCAARRRQVSCMPPRWQKTGLDIGATGCFNANVFFLAETRKPTQIKGSTVTGGGSCVVVFCINAFRVNTAYNHM